MSIFSAFATIRPANCGTLPAAGTPKLASLGWARTQSESSFRLLAPVLALTAMALKYCATPAIGVKSFSGFLVNRVLGPYMQNAFRLMDEGVKPETIDAAMEEFGMPMGRAARLVR